MINELDFLNRNLLRAYPIRQDSTCLSNEGAYLPTSVIAGLSLSIPTYPNAIDYTPYIAQVYINNGYITVAISIQYTLASSTIDKSVGTFQGRITDNFQSLELTSFDDKSSGFITIGQSSFINTNSGIYTFNVDATPLEISTYFIFPTPGVNSLIYRNKSLTGTITAGTWVNVSNTISGQNIELAVTDPTDIISLGDTDSEFRNCPTPVITNINTMVPYPEDNLADDANIYLFGIDPVKFFSDSITGAINVSTGDLTLNTFCTKIGLVIPPTDPTYLVDRPDGFTGIESYYSKSETPIENFMVVPVSKPEYVFWPYFATTYNLSEAAPTSGSTYTIVNPATILGNLNRLKVQVTTGTINFTIKIAGVAVGGVTSIECDSYGVVVLPTSNFSFNDTQSITITINSVTGTPANMSLWLYYSPQPTS